MDSLRQHEAVERLDVDVGECFSSQDPVAECSDPRFLLSAYRVKIKTFPLQSRYAPSDNANTTTKHGETVSTPLHIV